MFKNAEIDFNFGDRPFSYGPPQGFVPVCKADQECTILNAKDGVSNVATAPLKMQKNAPLAIIVEVTMIFLWNLSLTCAFFLCAL